MSKRYEKYGSYVWVALMVVTLGLLMYLGRFNHPTGDDYYYAHTTRKIWVETGSIVKVIEAALKGVVQEYYRWQGTYSAMFLMHIPPNVFGEQCYKWVTTLILSLYTAGVFYFLKPLLCGFCKGSKHLWVSVSAIYVLLTIQTVPFHGESFYWYNGSMYYTGYWSLTMVFGGMLCRYILDGKKRYLSLMALLAVFLAGGNYVSLLPCILLTATLSVLLLFKKSKKGIWVGVMVLLMVAGLAVSAAAPGNQMRQNELWETSAVEAVIKAIRQGFRYIEGYLRGWWWLAAVLVTPLFWSTYSKIKFTFRFPVLVVGYLFGIFCSMSCPTFYAMNNTGPARALAIIYYGFMLFTLMAYYYFLGSCYRYYQKYLAKSGKKKEEKKGAGKWSVGLWCTAIVLLLGIQIVTGEVTKCNFVCAARTIQKGEAAIYEQEYQKRLEVLGDDSVRDVVFLPYTVKPELVFVGDFTGDVNNVNNINIAKYFNKDSLMVQYD